MNDALINQRPTVALVGNPNCGKTTLFNKLTGSNQRVGNWSGVTVERKMGVIKAEEGNLEIIDLPGVYSLSVVSNEVAIDEKLTADYLATKHTDIVVNVIDASNLERNLYLTLQLLERGLSVIVVLNRFDILRKKGLDISEEALSNQLGCKVVSTVATRKEGLLELQNQLFRDVSASNIQLVNYPKSVQLGVDEIAALLLDKQKEWNIVQAKAKAISYLEGVPVEAQHKSLQNVVTKQQNQILRQEGQEADIIIAKARYQIIEQISKKVIQHKAAPIQAVSAIRTYFTKISKKADDVVLHRYLGIPVFLAVMYCLFMFAINIGGAFQEFFDISSNALFVEGVGYYLAQHNAPSWMITILAQGIGKGINTLVTFIPVIGAMFFALAFLEECGYMARAAFVMDRFMRAIGLPGKSFVPMIVGFGCNVPAIMGARTLERKRDRILTVVMSPFMSCGARLAIFTLFVAAFFPEGGPNVVFLLYLIGIAMAILTGLLLKKTLLAGEPTAMVLELPSFQFPSIDGLLHQAWFRLRRFISNAGKLIIPICLLIGVLNNVYIPTNNVNVEQSQVEQHSVLAMMGKTITPIFAPMGIEQDNWPATVGLFTGVLAKEVVIGTLNSLYAQQSDSVEDLAYLDSYNLITELTAAFQTIPQNLSKLGGALLNPIKAAANLDDIPEAHERIYGEMQARFNGKIGAFAYLLFVLLYFPCVSATAAMLKEVDRKWTIFSVTWTTAIAYSSAVLFYQLSTFSQHPVASFSWVFSIVSTLALVIFIMRKMRFQPARHLPTPVVLTGA